MTRAIRTLKEIMFDTRWCYANGEQGRFKERPFVECDICGETTYGAWFPPFSGGDPSWFDRASPEFRKEMARILALHDECRAAVEGAVSLAGSGQLSEVS